MECESRVPWGEGVHCQLRRQVLQLGARHGKRDAFALGGPCGEVGSGEEAGVRDAHPCGVRRPRAIELEVG